MCVCVLYDYIFQTNFLVFIKFLYDRNYYIIRSFYFKNMKSIMFKLASIGIP